MHAVGAAIPNTSRIVSATGCQVIDVLCPSATLVLSLLDARILRHGQGVKQSQLHSTLKSVDASTQRQVRAVVEMAHDIVLVPWCAKYTADIQLKVVVVVVR